MYAVTVTFQIKPDRLADFMPLMLSNARTSLRDEAACHQFDVAQDPAHANEVFLYEIYEDRAGFDTHLASAHFKAFDKEVAQMIQSKSLRTYEQVVQ
jgi:quinol monooxygenase YgiN